MTLQWVNVTGDPTGATGSGAGFVTGGLNQLGAIESIKVTAAGGSVPITVTLVLDKNQDGQFLCPAGSAAVLCGDAVAVFLNTANAGNGHEFVYNNQDALAAVFFEPCAIPAAGGCLKGGPGGPFPTVTLAELKGGKMAGNDGFTPAVLAFGLPLGAAPVSDDKATVSGVEVNGMQYLP